MTTSTQTKKNPFVAATPEAFAFEKIADGIEYAPDGEDFGVFRVALTGGKPSKSGNSMLTANSAGFQPLKAGVKYTLIVSRPRS
jgi:hypothetical protein